MKKALKENAKAYTKKEITKMREENNSMTNKTPNL
jgi:hypothetical protein